MSNRSEKNRIKEVLPFVWTFLFYKGISEQAIHEQNYDWQVEIDNNINFLEDFINKKIDEPDAKKYRRIQNRIARINEEIGFRNYFESEYNPNKALVEIKTVIELMSEFCYFDAEELERTMNNLLSYEANQSIEYEDLEKIRKSSVKQGIKKFKILKEILDL